VEAQIEFIHTVSSGNGGEGLETFSIVPSLRSGCTRWETSRPSPAALIFKAKLGSHYLELDQQIECTGTCVRHRDRATTALRTQLQTAGIMQAMHAMPCHDALVMVYLKCTIFSEPLWCPRWHVDENPRTHGSDECYATDESYLQSSTSCIHSHCDIETLPYKKQNSCFPEMVSNGLPISSLEGSFPTGSPTEELSEHTMWLNEADRKSESGTADKFEHSEVYHMPFP
jgi:hypothetical protein